MSRSIITAVLLVTVATSTSAAGSKSSGNADRRREAIASLRAVRSAVDAGATLDDFRKYQIESRIKVDALPNTAVNRDIREISDLYRVALQFGTIALTGEITSAEIEAARHRYSSLAGDPLFKGILDALDKMVPGAEAQLSTAYAPAVVEQARYELQKNRIYAGEVVRLLIASADEKLRKLK